MNRTGWKTLALCHQGLRIVARDLTDDDDDDDDDKLYPHDHLFQDLYAYHEHQKPT